MDRVKRTWYLSHMRAAKVQASLRIRAVSPEPSQLAHTSSESRGTFRQKARSLAPLNGWACAVETCHDGMLEDTNSLDGAQMAAVKALDQVDFPVHALSEHSQTLIKKQSVKKKHNRKTTTTKKHGQVQNAVNLSKSNFMASIVFMQMFNVSTLCTQSIRWHQ